MTRLLAATAVLALVSGSAMAWDAKTNGPASPIGQDGGMAQGQVAKSASRSSARSTASTGPVTIYNSTGGTGSAMPSTAASDPSGGRGYSGGTRVIGQAPDVLIPSIGGGGSDCPVVGFGVGGSGLSGGGGFGPSWISTRCDHRKYAEMIYQLTGNREAALSYLASVEPDVKQWLDAQSVSSAPVVYTPFVPPLPFPDGDHSDEACPVGLYGAALHARPWCNQEE